MAGLGDRLGQDQQARPSRDRSRRRVPRHHWRRRHRDAVGSGPGDGIEEGARTVPADPGAQRKGVSEATATARTPARSDEVTPDMRGWEPPSYWPFIAPAL